MILPSPRHSLFRFQSPDKSMLALDTGFSVDCAEAQVLSRVARGTGQLVVGERVTPWRAQGVQTIEGRLVIPGIVDSPPDGQPCASWPLDSASGPAFVQTLSQTWLALHRQGLPVGRFSSTALVPFVLDAGGWAFLLLPSDLAEALESLTPVSQTAQWDLVLHPDATGNPSWAFALASLGMVALGGDLPWSETDDAERGQEIRELAKTLDKNELPMNVDDKTRDLWVEALKMVPAAAQPERWQSLKFDAVTVEPGPEFDERATRHSRALEARRKRRGQKSFWRRKGTLVTIASVIGLAVVGLVGSVVWQAVKPDPTDQWTPRQVIEGYYRGLETLDSDLLNKISKPQAPNTQALDEDQQEASNRFVIRQVRSAYEQKSPILKASDWISDGRPALVLGQMLWGLVDVRVTGNGENWTVTYQKWVSEGDEKSGIHAVGQIVEDHLTLGHFSRGWKVIHLGRTVQPLP